MVSAGPEMAIYVLLAFILWHCKTLTGVFSENTMSRCYIVLLEAKSTEPGTQEAANMNQVSHSPEEADHCVRQKWEFPLFSRVSSDPNKARTHSMQAEAGMGGWGEGSRPSSGTNFLPNLTSLSFSELQVPSS